MPMSTVAVPFYVGDGDPISLEIAYIAEFPRATDGTCAMCLGDPLAETSPLTSAIARFYSRNRAAETCPLCQGRPT